MSVVRELHVYGSVVPVSARDPGKFQYRGFGTLLMEEAERIARDEHGARKLAVISGERASEHTFLPSAESQTVNKCTPTFCTRRGSGVINLFKIC